MNQQMMEMEGNGMCDQELEFHVRKLEQAFNAAPPSRQQGMKLGIQCMILSLKAGNKPLPLSLRRMKRQIERDEAAELFNNLPV